MCLSMFVKQTAYTAIRKTTKRDEKWVVYIAIKD